MDKRTIAHAGIKGMKWGVRRFQNKDGSLTEAGKKRYDRDTRDLSDKKKAKYQPDVDKWVKDDISSTRRVAEESSSALRKMKDLNDSGMRRKKAKRMNLDSMSDKEMRDKINRELLERQYNDVFNPAKVSRGREVVSRILDTSAAVLGIGASALGIALAIKELRG